MAIGTCKDCKREKVEGQRMITPNGSEFVCNTCGLKEKRNPNFRAQQAAYAAKTKV